MGPTFKNEQFLTIFLPLLIKMNLNGLELKMIKQFNSRLLSDNLNSNFSLIDLLVDCSLNEITWF